MLRFFHSYRKTVFGILVVSLAALSMTGFGINAFQNYEQSQVYAVKVDDTRVDFMQFQREKEQLQNRYRAMLGKNYGQLAPLLEANLGQQVVEKVIADVLMLREARKNDLYSGPDELQRLLRTQIFGGNFDPELYRQYLREMNQSAASFERDVSDSAVRAQFVGLLSDAAFASTEEARAMWEREETSYAVRHLAFDPAAFEAKVAVSDEKALEAFYADHASEYEQPARAAYDYVVFDPAKFRDLVQPSAEDVEMYYQDNQNRYLTQLEIRVRHIQFTYGKDAKPDEMAKVKERANEALVKAQAGEPFDALANQYSDDLTSNTIGGELGVLVRGKRDPAFEAAAMKLLEGQISDLVSTPYGYHIIKVDSRKEPEPKKLEEVKDSIVQDLKVREAPAYTADKAQQIFEEWQKSDRALAEVAKAQTLTLGSTAGLLAAEADPAPELSTLTNQVIGMSDVKKQIAELGDRIVLVELKELKEPSIPSFAEVKEKVTAAFRKAEGVRLAREAAAKALETLQKDDQATLDGAAKELKLTVVDTPAISRAKPGSGILADAGVQEAIFGSFTPLAKPSRVFEVDGKSYIVQVKAITKPDQAAAAEKIGTYKTRAAEANAQSLINSVLATLKANASIDVDPQLLARQG